MNQKILFTKDECDRIINYKDSFDILDKSLKNRVDNNINKKHYNLYLIEKNDTTNWIFNRLFEWFTNETNIKISNDTIKRGILINYKIGDVFPKHIDANTKFEYRMYNIGIQLSLDTDYNGGEYIVYNKNPEKTIISKEVGNSYYYDAKLLHEITKIKKGERWAFLYHITKENISFKINKII